MREVFIGILLPEFAAAAFRSLEAQANEELKAYPGCEGIVLSHGQSPFHLTLVSPFTSKDVERDTQLESGLARMSQGVAPFTLTLGTLMTIAPSTVAVAAKDRPGLTALRTAVHTAIHRPQPQEFWPHVSVARKFPRERSKDVQEACVRAYVKQSSFPLSFRVEGLTLFGREADGWEAHTTYHFGGRSAAL